MTAIVDIYNSDSKTVTYRIASYLPLDILSDDDMIRRLESANWPNSWSIVAERHGVMADVKITIDSEEAAALNIMSTCFNKDICHIVAVSLVHPAGESNKHWYTPLWMTTTHSVAEE